MSVYDMQSAIFITMAQSRPLALAGNSNSGIPPNRPPPPLATPDVKPETSPHNRVGLGLERV